MVAARRGKRILAIMVAVMVAMGMLGTGNLAYGAASPQTPDKLKAKAAKTSVTLTWKKADGAKGYQVYMKQGSAYKKVKTISKGKTVKYVRKNLSKNKTYKFKVRSVNGNEKSGFSKVVSARTTASGKKNAQSVKISKTSVLLVKGETDQVKGTVTPSKNVVSKTVRYMSTDKAVATVSSKGVITAKEEGTCYVRAMAHNGRYKSCKVTVQAALSMKDQVASYIDKADKDFAWDVTETLSYDPQYWDGTSGFRTAGSDAEHRAADYLVGLFKEIGLTDVQKEGVTVDKWQFNGATFNMKSETPAVNISLDGMDIVSYASSGTDADGITGEVVYMKQGFESDYEAYYDEQGLEGKDRNMNGKIVLIDINQDMDYWITPHYQEAARQGAAALMSYSSQYVNEDGSLRGDKWDEAVQIQDLCSRDLKLPCVSISRKAGLEIIDAVEAMKAAEIAPEATIVVDNIIDEGNGTSYNVSGVIKGSGNTGQQIIVAGHYDKYFYGTNDDSAAIGVVAAMAKGMIDAGYEPVNDIIFVAHGAEEWGKTGTETDWAEGSWGMITDVHPEWQGSTLGLINFELPARHGTADGTVTNMRTTEETFALQNTFVSSGLLNAIEKGMDINQRASSQPMSDELCYQFMGVPTFEINAQTGTGAEPLSTYHTKYDDKDDYNATSMDYALKTSGSLAIYLDSTPALKLGFEERCDELEAAIAEDESLYTEADVDIAAYKSALASFREAGSKFAAEADRINGEYEAAVAAGDDAKAAELRTEALKFNEQGLAAYRYLQDQFLGMGGDGGVHIFHKIIQNNIELMDTVIDGMSKADMGQIMENAWQINGGIDYGAYNFSNDISLEALETVFCKYVQDNRAYGKKVGRVDVYEATHAIAAGTNSEGFKDEIALYTSERNSLLPELKEYIEKETKAMNEMVNKLAF